jgi:hypothetical protein
MNSLGEPWTMMTKPRLSRRNFLQLSAFGSVGLSMLGKRRSMASTMDGLLGRSVRAGVPLYASTTSESDFVGTLSQDEILVLEAAVWGREVVERNGVWYRMGGRGYAHSADIQPVRNLPNPSLSETPYAGTLVEVTIPYADIYAAADPQSDHLYRYYYGTTHWVHGHMTGADGEVWYSLFDDKWDIFYYAKAAGFRAIPSEELLPLSPHIPPEQKRIEVDLDRQWATCFEGEQVVFVAKVSSGILLDNGSYWTPEGVFSTFYKRPSRHMVAGNRASGYDLPGVPWVSYITDYGISFHGTYWHNAFGVPRSHGCINMTSEAARFIYRWTTPVVQLDQTWVREESGTTVKVFRTNASELDLPHNNR